MKPEQKLYLIVFEFATKSGEMNWIIEAGDIIEALHIFNKTAYPDTQCNIKNIKELGLNGQITLKELENYYEEQLQQM